MIKISIISIGKTKESWLHDAVEEYTKRLKTTAEITWKLAKNDSQLEAYASEESSLIILTPEGKQMSSEEFSEMVQSQGARISFLIGGAEGVPEHLKKKGPNLSLSRMTFTHQITRLVLIEQIYRAFEIAKGSRYHK